jgi:hypothetical protein
VRFWVNVNEPFEMLSGIALPLLLLILLLILLKVESWNCGRNKKARQRTGGPKGCYSKF